MVALLAATLFSASFSLIVRHAQRRDCNLWAVGAINYLVAAAVHLLRWSVPRLVGSQSWEVTPSTVIIGLLGGCLYVGSYFLLFPFMQARGVSIATAILRLSVVIPIGISILFWGERPLPIQTAGAMLALISLPLLAFRPPARDLRETGETQPGKTRWLVLIALFVGNGLCATSVRAFRQTGIESESALFLGTLFGTAAVIGVVGWLSHRQGSVRHDLPSGVALGLANALGNLALVAALTQLPGVLVFPFQSAVGLVYVAVVARLAWQERIIRTEAMGMAMALAAVVLINLG